jgi:hypothetical protein
MKRRAKKLNLNRETLRMLTQDQQLRQVAAAGPTNYGSCASNCNESGCPMCYPAPTVFYSVHAEGCYTNCKCP